MKNLPYENQCTKDRILNEVATQWKAIDQNIAIIYPDLPSLGYNEANTPLTAFRAGSAQILADYVTELQALPKKPSTCDPLPSDVVQSVQAMKEAADDLRERYQSVRVKVAGWKAYGHEVTRSEYFGEILPTLLEGAWRVSVAKCSILFCLFNLIIDYKIFLLQLSATTSDVARDATKN